VQSELLAQQEGIFSETSDLNDRKYEKRSNGFRKHGAQEANEKHFGILDFWRLKTTKREAIVSRVLLPCLYR
jgi:hypothetical protein